MAVAEAETENSICLEAAFKWGKCQIFELLMSKVDLLFKFRVLKKIEHNQIKFNS